MSKLPLEKDVEAAFLEFIERGMVSEPAWTSVWRQVRLPLGIVDIMGFSEGPYGHACVVEVKRGTIDRKAVGQLAGYVSQMNDIVKGEIRGRVGFAVLDVHDDFKTAGYLVGKSIDQEALRAVLSLGYDVWLYDVIDGQIEFWELGPDSYVVDAACDYAAEEIAGKVVDRWEAHQIHGDPRPVHVGMYETAVSEMYQKSLRTVYKAEGTDEYQS